MTSSQKIRAQDVMVRAAQSDHSPCVGHCTLDATDHCLSCRRHIDEVDGWSDANARLRRDVWGRIPAEIDKAGLDVMRLPLSPEDINALAIKQLHQGGAWAVGAGAHWHYAHALISKEGIAKERMSGEGNILTAKSHDGHVSITLDLSGKMRALAWARSYETSRSLANNLNAIPILIVVPKARIKTEPHTKPTPLDDGRTDLGFGLPSVRFLTHGHDLIIETMLAQARIKKTQPPHPITNPLPPNLALPEAFVLAAIILPKGEKSLST